MRSLQVILALVVTLCMSSSAFALSGTELSRILNLSGKQRMLTQKMSKEVLFVVKGIDPLGNVQNLQQTAALFDKTLKGLEFGDEDLHLVKTEDAAIINQLHVVQQLWKEFKPYIDQVAQSRSASPEVLSAIATKNVPLLAEMNKTVKMYEQSAGGSNMDQGLAVTINLAGKQRMLTQKMTKELLLVVSHIDTSNNTSYLQRTIALFDRTLKGLKDGDVILKLPGTKNETIRNQLTAIAGIWSKYMPILKKGPKVTPRDLELASTLNLTLLKKMNKAVLMYEKQGL